MPEPSTVVVVGAGQAGLAVSHELERASVNHVVLERGRVGQAWRDRWESFCLVTPNWTIRLPGAEYEGDDPDGFLARDEVVDHLGRYAGRLRAPLHEGVEVRSLAREPRGGFRLETSDGELLAGTVVLCTGAYQRPHTLPIDEAPVEVLDVGAYTAPADLPAGPVLVVGSAQSGCQIAEELRQAGREVFLACGRAAWSSRRIGDHDLIWWGHETGYLDMTVEQLPEPAARLAGNIVATGRDGGHDLHLRTLHAMGVRLLGHLEGVAGRHARFADDLPATIAFGDQRRAAFLGARAQAGGRPRAARAGPAGARAAARRAGHRARPDGLRRGHRDRRLPPRLRALGRRPRRLRRVRLPGPRGLPVDRRARAVVLRRALPAQAQVVAAQRGRRGRRAGRRGDRRGG